MKNSMWVVIPKPHGAKVVSYRWLYKLNDGVKKVEPITYKPRLIT